MLPGATVVKLGWMAEARRPLQAGAIDRIPACLPGGPRTDTEPLLGLPAGTILDWLAKSKRFQDKWGPASPKSEGNHGESGIT